MCNYNQKNILEFLSVHCSRSHIHMRKLIHNNNNNNRTKGIQTIGSCHLNILLYV